MKQYLNREEKLNIIAICWFAEHLENCIKHEEDKDIRKWLKAAQTYLNKAWQKRLDSIDSYSTAMSLIRMAKQYEIEFRPKLASTGKYSLEKLGIKPTNAKGCPYDVWGDAIEQ